MPTTESLNTDNARRT